MDNAAIDCKQKNVVKKCQPLPLMRANRGEVYSAWRIWLFQCSLAVISRDPLPSVT